MLHSIFTDHRSNTVMLVSTTPDSNNVSPQVTETSLLTQVDVFAFGMTLYELLALRPPFDDINPAFKRNHEIRDKHRPLLKARETRSLVLLQDLMRMCWEQDPDERPTMGQVMAWVEMEEFERLRAEVALGGVRSISCAKVCRIVPENEDEYRGSRRSSSISPTLDDIAEEREGDEEEMEEEEEEEEGEGGAKFLPSILEDSCHVLKAEGLTEVDGDQDVYQFVPQGKNASHASFHLDHSYTQIWMCGRDQKKGLLHIFTYYDDQPGFHVCTHHTILGINGNITKRTKYRTHRKSCEWKYMFISSLQPTHAQDDSIMWALSYSTKSCAVST